MDGLPDLGDGRMSRQASREDQLMHSQSCGTSQPAFVVKGGGRPTLSHRDGCRVGRPYSRKECRSYEGMQAMKLEFLSPSFRNSW